LWGGASHDLLTTGDGDNDVLYADHKGHVGSHETLLAGNGTGDTLYGGSGAYDVLEAGNGGDWLVGGKGNHQLLIGGSGNDTFTAGTGGDTLEGGSGGVDLFNVGNKGNDTIEGSASGFNTVNFTDHTVSDIHSENTTAGVTTIVFNSGQTVVLSNIQEIDFKGEPTQSNPPGFPHIS
jgi:Ca2+-binding RTX toxin-like protein